MRCRLCSVVWLGCLVSLASLRAQEPSLPEADSSSGGTEAAPVSPPPATPAPGAASSFGTYGTSDSGGTTPPAPSESPAGSSPTPGFSANPAATLSGASSLSGLNPGVTAPESISYTIPGGYGQAPQTFVAGAGRLARPHFEYSGSVSFGYDDNTLSTPFNAVSRDEVTERVQTQAEVPAHLQEVFRTLPRGGSNANGQRPYYFVLVPEQKAKFQNVIVAPAQPAPKVEGSFAVRANAAAEVQFSSRRTIFTMDLRGAATEYFSRSRDPLEYNGSLAVTYLHRITPRLQFTGSANLAYLTQPDLTRINAPTNGTGDYFNANAKFDLSYSWSPRFSTVSTLSINSQLFTDQTEQTRNFYEVVFGTEARWRYTPRLTLVGEARYGRDLYENDETLNSSSVFLLVGGEITLTRRLTASLRGGQELRTFEQSGDSRTSPYVEANLAYQYSHTGTVSWNSRIGFESPQNSNSTNQVFRSSVEAVQAFSVRTRASLTLAAVHRVVTDEATDSELLDNSFEIDFGLGYTLSKHATFTANYTFIGDLSSQTGSNYVRNQLFAGVQYAF